MPTLSTALPASRPDRSARVTPGALSRVEIVDSMTTAEAPWRWLEREDAVLSPYQRFDWIAPWQNHVGARAGVTPYLVTGFDAAGAPLFLWPLGRSQAGPLTVARFLGGKHANFNFGLWRRDFAERLTGEQLRALLARLPASGAPVDLLALSNQPREWDGLRNPFAQLAHQPSPSFGYRLRLEAPGEQLINQCLSSAMRGRLRTKERKLQKLAGYRYFKATTAEAVDRLLDVFFAQKAARLQEHGIYNVFGEPGMEAFLRGLSHTGLAQGRPIMELHALEGGGEVLALFGGTADHERFSSMISSYTLSDQARHSPGLIILIHMIKAFADRGLRMFDLGVGEAKYKTFFCNDREVLFDSFLPLSLRGRLAAQGARGAFGIKRRIKQSPALWNAWQAVRRRLSGGRAADDN